MTLIVRISCSLLLAGPSELYANRKVLGGPQSAPEQSNVFCLKAQKMVANFGEREVTKATRKFLRVHLYSKVEKLVVTT